MQPSSRLERIPPYLFAELERKIAREARRGHRRDLAGHRRPRPADARRSSSRPCRRRWPTPAPTATRPTAGARSSARRSRDFYERRFDVDDSTPRPRSFPPIGAKECIFNLNLAFLDPGDVALAADPGYPVYTGGPLLAGGEPVLMPLVPELRLRARPRRHRRRRPRARPADVPQLPEQPDRRRRARRVLRPGGRVRARARHPRRPRQRLQRDRASTATARRRSSPRPEPRTSASRCSRCRKGYNMTGWRCAAIVGHAAAIEAYWRLKSNIDSGNFDAVQLAGVAALSPDGDAEVASMNRALPAPPRPRRRGAARDRRRGHAAQGHDLHLGAGARGLRVLGRLLRARARGGRGRPLARRRLRPQRRGLLPHLADRARRPAARGGRAARPPGGVSRA